MAAARYAELLAALSAGGVRHVVVGGFATNLHGFLRYTHDLDLVLDLEPANVAAALAVFQSFGLRPWLPVPLAEFADAARRADWYENRNLIVFTLVDPKDPGFCLDLFVREPMPFAELWRHSEVVSVAGSSWRIAGVEHLMAMKRAAGRDQDLRDIAELEALRQHPDDRR